MHACWNVDIKTVPTPYHNAPSKEVVAPLAGREVAIDILSSNALQAVVCSWAAKKPDGQWNWLLSMPDMAREARRTQLNFISQYQIREALDDEQQHFIPQFILHNYGI